MNITKKKLIKIPVAVIGAGIAGLVTSYYLKKRNIDHIIVERGEVANTWINERLSLIHI